MKVVDYEILTQELFPPIGNMWKYNAVIQFLFVETPEGNKRVNPDLGETYGKTPDEAKKKMQKKYDEWVADQG